MLDLALNTDSQGEDSLYRDDVKVTMADSGLYDFLLKVVNVQGIGGRGEEGGEDGIVHNAHEEQKKEKDDKKSMLGKLPLHIDLYISKLFISNRCTNARLYRQIPTLPRNIAQDNLTIPTSLPVPPSP